MSKEVHVNFYTKIGCPLCDKGKAVLLELSETYNLKIEDIDIYKDDVLLEKYQIMIPVVEIDGDEVDYGIISKEIVEDYFLSKKNISHL
ncbi:glutaredoxin family protein [Bacillus sp. Marseille-P3661]|uniref:glutaredoxin family protein n=1 Tax=Bacillus sp. Marseille-P3661 TaxID=1936234 RepID=UPI000C85F9D3|nr:glutaredoxin family protein [Bacillus sp. Marseille-P3661]